MTISIEKIHEWDSKGGATLAYCNLVLNSAVVIKGCRIMEGKYGIFMKFPSKRNDKEGETNQWNDIVIAIDKEFKRALDGEVKQAWADHCRDRGTADHEEPETKADDDSSDVPF